MRVRFFPDAHAQACPDQPAYVMARTGEAVSYAKLARRSRQAARVMRAAGARHGSCVGLLMENHVRFLELAWAAQRSGLRYTAMSPQLTVDEVAYMLEDSAAALLFASAETERVARAAAERAAVRVQVISVDAEYDACVSAQLAVPLEDECEGAEFLYSSGTTGRPKGVVSEVSLAPIGTPPAFLSGLQQLYGFDAETVYLSPAPLHHSAPLRAVMLLHRLGATTVVMDRFDAAWTLELVERYRVTHTQMVPTMFVRLLRLPAERRAQHDLSSLRCVIHAAAPCPPDVKAAMIDWLGPIVCEYYSATEMYAYTCIDSADWLAHRGSVGRALFGALHILDDSGRELPFGEPGTVWAESGPAFEYHNDPVKSAQARNERGWTTVGDIGYLDADGYLYLTDRKADMIIVGGVNVYPQEAENALIGHPAVEDVAVVGIPHPELGEEVKGVVQPRLGITPHAALEAELIDYCRQRLAYYKCPRSIDFVDELPRQPTGKLYRRLLRDRYSSAP